ncbi:hypothetical protein AB0A69_28325 [Streptomyces sp. NPDC045431]|uniref:hypothetical protein n=1 Tax=Streptomyces sp. NPDC045431 TaxID=3155613 RepID=UPI0033C0521B
MSVARRPLLTATAAGTLLCALWFVPSANATAEDPVVRAPEETRTNATSTVSTLSTVSTASQPQPQQQRQELALADTGSVDTTPYLIGGTAFLTLGAGLVAFAVRRGAHTAL